MMKTQTKNRNSSGPEQAVLETDWGFGAANTKELTHEIHRYSGKYIPQIASRAIELISSRGETILDPYVGSGTTLLEANLSGRRSLGIDLNPLAVLISKVKTTPIDGVRLSELLRYFEEVAGSMVDSENGRQKMFGRSTACDALIAKARADSRLTDVWYRKWFSQKTLEGLLVLDHAVRAHPDAACADLAKVSFSNVLRRCSNAHGGYPNVMIDKKKNNEVAPAPIFIKSLNDAVAKVRDLNNKFDRQLSTQVLLGDATQLPLENESVDAIVTHPPYIGSVPYAEYGLLSLKWLGYEPKEIDGKLTGGRRQSKDVVDRFADSYGKMIAEGFRVLRRGKYMFILIGDPTVKGQKIDLSQMTRDLAAKAGFRLVVENQRAGMNRRANKMGAETLLFFQKN